MSDSESSGHFAVGLSCLRDVSSQPSTSRPKVSTISVRIVPIAGEPFLTNITGNVASFVRAQVDTHYLIWKLYTFCCGVAVYPPFLFRHYVPEWISKRCNNIYMYLVNSGVLNPVLVLGGIYV